MSMLIIIFDELQFKAETPAVRIVPILFWYILNNAFNLCRMKPMFGEFWLSGASIRCRTSPPLSKQTGKLSMALRLIIEFDFSVTVQAHTPAHNVRHVLRDVSHRNP